MTRRDGTVFVVAAGERSIHIHTDTHHELEPSAFAQESLVDTTIHQVLLMEIGIVMEKTLAGSET